METDEPDELLSAAAAASFLGISRSVLLRLVLRKRLGAVWTARRWWFRRSDLLDYQESTPAPEEVVDTDAAPMVRMVDALLLQAIEADASDIHIEPDPQGVRIRYRIDGVLRPAMTLPAHVRAPLIARLNILADLPQRSMSAGSLPPGEGRIPIEFDGRKYTLRVSCLSSLYGESLALRILDSSFPVQEASALGLTAEMASRLETLLSPSRGLFLFAGASGSGKTTTLYSLLHRMNVSEKHIVAIGRRVEYELPSITQVGLDTSKGVTVRAVVRSVLRQNPDVLVLDDLSDNETVRAAMEAALTGPLVLSTLGADDADSALLRLRDFGVEPSLLAQVLIGILSQRLVRRICPSCREPCLADAEELRPLGFTAQTPGEPITLYRGSGCEKCRGQGYRGRLGIFELLPVNAPVADLLRESAPLPRIREAGGANGMTTLSEDALGKVLDGSTTPGEVLRAGIKRR